MIDVYVHGSVEGADQQGLVGAQGFVSSVNGLGLPVGPVDVLLKQSHGKDVRDVMSQHNVSVGSIQAGKSNVVFTSVCPVDAVINKI